MAITPLLVDQIEKGLLTDKSDAIGSCNLKPNDNDNENDDNLSSN